MKHSPIFGLGVCIRPQGLDQHIVEVKTLVRSPIGLGIVLPERGGLPEVIDGTLN
jgi:hypothetical protein